MSSTAYPVKERKRKPRFVNNAIVNLDDVTVERGDEYKNWAQCARHKLYQREIALTQQRLTICDRSIVCMIQKFAFANREIFGRNQALSLKTNAINFYTKYLQSRIIGSNSAVSYQYAQSLIPCLSKWKGYQPKPKAPPIKTFRDYFAFCRKWFDLTKMELLAVNFWIPIFHLIDKLAIVSESHNFNIPSLEFYDAYTAYLRLFIFEGLFKAQWKPSNTRRIWLVPATVYATFVQQTYPIMAPLNIARDGNKGGRESYFRLIQNKIKSSKEVCEEELYKAAQSTSTRCDKKQLGR